MPGFSNLPNFGGTINAYGIDPVLMPMQASLLPGGGSGSAAAPLAWIVPGSAPLPKALGLGCATGYAGAVPGGLGATAPGFNSSFTNPGNFNANTASSSASNVSNQSQNSTSNITIQSPAGGGMLSGDNAPLLLGAVLLAALGYIATK